MTAIRYVLQGGIYLLNLVDYSVSGFPLLFVALLELVAINWIYGYKRFSDDIKMMLGHKPNIYWKVCWLGLSPAVVGVGDYYYTTTITLNLTTLPYSWQ